MCFWQSESGITHTQTYKLALLACVHRWKVTHWCWGGWWWSRAEGMNLVPIIGRRSPCASPSTPLHPPLSCGTALPGGEGVGQDTLPLRGLIGVAPLWFTWPKQLNSGPRPLVCHYKTSDKAANWAVLSIMCSHMSRYAREMKQPCLFL